MVGVQTIKVVWPAGHEMEDIRENFWVKVLSPDPSGMRGARPLSGAHVAAFKKSLLSLVNVMETVKCY
jgi:hypothetical protein